MITKITIKPGTKSYDALFFKEASLSDFPDRQVIPLFGANGAGKSTFIDAIRSDFAYRQKAETIRKKISDLKKEREKYHSTHKDCIVSKLTDDDIAFWNRTLEREKGKREAECEGIVKDKKYALYFYRNGDTNFSNSPAGKRDAYDPARLSLFWDAGHLSEGQSLVFSVNGLLDGLLKNESWHEDGTENIVLLDEIDSGLSIDNIDYLCRKIRRIAKKWSDTQVFIAFNSPEILGYFPYVLSMYDGKMHKIDGYDIMRAELKANKKMLDKARKKSNGQYRIFA